MSKKLGDISFITKLAGFEHTEYIQDSCSHTKVNEDDVPLFIGRTIRDGKIDTHFDWYIPLKLSQLLERSQLRKKCLVLPYVGTLGDLAIFDGHYAAHLGSNVAKIELNDNCGYSEEYIYYFLKSPYGQKLLLRYMQGGLQKNITMGAIRDVELPDLSVDDQKCITNVLSLIDHQIENNNAICAELEAMAKLLYDYWFVQFDFPDENGKPYKSSGGKMVWSEELKREIPERWEYRPFADCIQSINTGLNPRDNFKLNTGGNIRYLTVKNLTTQGVIDFSSCDYIDEDARSIVHRRSDVAVGDILFASIAPLGRCYLISEPPKDWDINESVFSIRPNYQRTTSQFLYMTFMSEAFIKKATNSSTGSVFKGIRINDLLSTMTLLPPIDLLLAFDKKVNELFAMKANCAAENTNLVSLRDFLLPLLMNGQVTFKEADCH